MAILSKALYWDFLAPLSMNLYFVHKQLLVANSLWEVVGFTLARLFIMSKCDT